MLDQIAILTLRSSRPAACEFAMSGTLDDGTVVTARYERGVLWCDEALKRRAEQLVRAGATFEQASVSRTHNATVSGDPVAIALTLIRAMQVVEFEITLDGATIKRVHSVDE